MKSFVNYLKLVLHHALSAVTYLRCDPDFPSAFYSLCSKTRLENVLFCRGVRSPQRSPRIRFMSQSNITGLTHTINRSPWPSQKCEKHRAAMASRRENHGESMANRIQNRRAVITRKRKNHRASMTSGRKNHRAAMVSRRKNYKTYQIKAEIDLLKTAFEL